MLTSGYMLTQSIIRQTTRQVEYHHVKIKMVKMD